MTQIKASLQVSYDLDQVNIVTYDFIANSNSLTEEAASLGNHTPWGVGYVNTCGKKSPESGVKETRDTILTGFYLNWSKLSDGESQSIFDER